MRRLLGWIRERGPVWTLLYGCRALLLAATGWLESWLVYIETRRWLTGESTISSRAHTMDQNRVAWDNYDWAEGGEEWTLDVAKYRGLEPERWKRTLITGMMLKYITEGSEVLEIGPGAGRWTRVLQPICRRLVVADISERCLAMCREAFKACGNVEYVLIEDGALGSVPDESIDHIWSYDVFVHINPTDTERYLRECRRILKAGGDAIVHHVGTSPSRQEAAEEWRSYMDRRFFAHLVTKHGLVLVEQNEALVHRPGDIISVFRKPLRGPVDLEGSRARTLPTS